MQIIGTLFVISVSYSCSLRKILVDLKYKVDFYATHKKRKMAIKVKASV